MTPADLLDLRRRVARVLPAPAMAALARPGAARFSAALWTCDGETWLPVLDDDGTIGAMLGELVRRGAAPHVVVRRVPGGNTTDARVVYVHPDDHARVTTADTLGVALALALVALDG